MYDLPIFFVRLGHFLSKICFGGTLRVTVITKRVLTENVGASISNDFWYVNLIGFIDFIRAVANVSCAEALIVIFNFCLVQSVLSADVIPQKVSGQTLM